MILRIKGYKIRYRKGFTILRSANPTIEKEYYISAKSEIKVNNKWVSCDIFVPKEDNKRTIKIIDRQYNGNQSELFEPLHVNRFWYLLIKVYDLLFDIKIWFNKKWDCIISIKRQIQLILIAILFACIYFFINLYFEDRLMDLIADSNFIQSILIFLSISSFINIFYPFTLRKEININDVKSTNKILIKKEQKKEKRKRQIEQRFKLN